MWVIRWFSMSSLFLVELVRPLFRVRVLGIAIGIVILGIDIVIVIGIGIRIGFGIFGIDTC